VGRIDPVFAYRLIDRADRAACLEATGRDRCTYIDSPKSSEHSEDHVSTLCEASLMDQRLSATDLMHTSLRKLAAATLSTLLKHDSEIQAIFFSIDPPWLALLPTPV